MYCRWPRSTCRPIYRSTVKVLVDRLSVDRRPIFDRYLTDTWPILHWQLIATYRPTHRPSVGRYIGRLSVDYWSTIGRLSVDSRPRPRIVHMIRIVLQKLPLFSKHSNIRSRTVKPIGKVVSIVWIWRYHGGSTEKSRKHYLQFTGRPRKMGGKLTDDIAQCFSLVVHEVRFRIVAQPKAWPLPIKGRKKTLRLVEN